jgi:uncharacterized membrane protein HdeD (DUF308 family)
MPIFAQVTFEVQRQWILYGSILALVTGILILIFPRILNYIVAVYLIIAGLLGLIPYIQPALNR